MKKEIEFINGESSPSSISFMSDKFQTSSRYKNGKIEVKTIKIPKITEKIQSKESIFMPRILDYLSDVINSWKEFIIFVLFSIYVIVQLVIFTIQEYEGTLEPPTIDWTFIIMFFTLVLLGLLLFKKYIGKMHGAEHMAIQAYKKEKSYDYTVISKQSRISPLCGGRFFLPFMIAMLVASVLPVLTGHRFYLVLSLIVLDELFLRLDHYGILEKIKIFTWSTHVLQKYLSTSPPGEKELLLAQAAMKALVEAHELEE